MGMALLSGEPPTQRVCRRVQFARSFDGAS
jgi:hypothetical protein